MCAGRLGGDGGGGGGGGGKRRLCGCDCPEALSCGGGGGAGSASLGVGRALCCLSFLFIRTLRRTLTLTRFVAERFIDAKPKAQIIWKSVSGREHIPTQKLLRVQSEARMAKRNHRWVVKTFKTDGRSMAQPYNI